MASSNEMLVSPAPLTLPNPGNGFVSNWLDKRSASVFGISIVFYGPNAPDGYAWIETSNAPFQSGSGYGQPNNGGDDATMLTGTQQTITHNTLTGNWDSQWQICGIGAHYVRLRYVSLSDVAGLTVNVYGSAPLTSD
jgi:hypothetical protein